MQKPPVTLAGSAGGGSSTEMPDITKLATLLAVHVRVAHYSNGQSGCFYQQFEPAPDSGCVRRRPPPDELNTRDGSFSTHYLEVGATYGKLGFASYGFDNTLTTTSLAVRWYPPVGGGGMDDELANLYSRFSLFADFKTRMNYTVLSRTRFRHRHELTALVEGECAQQRPSPADQCRATAELAMTFPALYGFGVFTRYAVGWDYYNIAFLNRLPHKPAVGIFLQHASPTFFGERWRPQSRR